VTIVGTRATVPVKVNGHEARFLVDSGFFYSSISPAFAERAGVGVRYEPGAQVRGVGGLADLKSAVVDVFSLADIPLRHKEFAVVQTQEANLAGIIGDDVLGAFDVEYDFANGVVRLFRPKDCGRAALAYWAPGGASVLPMDSPDFNPQGGAPKPNPGIIARGTVNGQRIRLKFDTGSVRSVMTLRAAARAGVTPQTPGATPRGQMSGVGSKRIDIWAAPFDSVSVGGEQIQHTRLLIGGVELYDVDMLLGADFFLSHRVLVANSQSKIYFTYNGGPVFQIDPPAGGRAQTAQVADASPPPQEQPASLPPATDGSGPTDASGFARRASAEAARLEYAAAIADFTRAIDLDPRDPGPLHDRGVARLASRQPALAMADFNAALKLKPDDAPTLMARAQLYAASGNRAGARTDLEAAARSSAEDPGQGLAVAGLMERIGLFRESLGQLDGWIEANPKADPGQKLRALADSCWVRSVLGAALDQALADCNNALKLRPHDLDALNGRAHVRLDRGEYDLAIADFDTALKTNPRTAVSLYGRGVAELKKGLKAEGETDIQAALAIDPRLAQRAASLGLAKPSDAAPAG
jgi:tetratricopeptide (TPR) repeat protein